MSLVGFRAENHPQQVGKRAARDDVDDRGTAPEYFEAFEGEFGPFTLDVAAAPHNAKCAAFYTREDDGLQQPWGGVVWCNPPYSQCREWVAKAWHEWRRGDCRRIVMLLPANRTEQLWWQKYVEEWRDDVGSPLRVRFLPGRMRFIRPNAIIGPKGDRPPFGCCLLIWDRGGEPMSMSGPTPENAAPRRLGDVTCAECSDTRQALLRLRAELDRTREALAAKEAQLERAERAIYDYESRYFMGGYPTWEGAA